MQYSYKNINLYDIIRDNNTNNLWSASSRAYELFGENLCDNQEVIKIPNLPWVKIIYSKLSPTELFFVINVEWDKAQWLEAKTIVANHTTFNAKQSKVRDLEQVLSVTPTLEQVRDEQTTFISALTRSNGMLTHACKRSGIPMKKYKSWLTSDLMFRTAVEEVSESIKDDVESVLIGEAKNGDLTAVSFFLNARGKDRGYGKNSEVKQEVVDNSIDLNLLTVDEQRELMLLLGKAQAKQLK